MPETGANNQDQRGEIEVDRRTIDAITTYEVIEDQLVIIETGSNSNDLNFAISLLSICASLIVTLSTTQIEGQIKLTAFWVATCVSGILGFYFLFEYRKKKKTSKSIFTTIRAQKSSRVVRDEASSKAPVTDSDQEQSS